MGARAASSACFGRGPVDTFARKAVSLLVETGRQARRGAVLGTARVQALTSGGSCGHTESRAAPGWSLQSLWRWKAVC